MHIVLETEHKGGVLALEITISSIKK